jgi:hypothetical protein
MDEKQMLFELLKVYLSRKGFIYYDQAINECEQLIYKIKQSDTFNKLNERALKQLLDEKDSNNNIN